MVTTRADFWSGTTARARRFKSPLREFLRTESGGAAVLLAATVTAVVWVNVDASSYQGLWKAVLAIDLGGRWVELTLREWVNSGLMTFFFSCWVWRRGASSTSATFASGGASCFRCLRRSAAWAPRWRSTSRSTSGA